MNPMPELAPQLKQLRLSGILNTLEARTREAIELPLPARNRPRQLNRRQSPRPNDGSVSWRHMRASSISH